MTRWFGLGAAFSAERRVTAQRRSAIGELRAIAETYDADGKTAEAAAVRVELEWIAAGEQSLPRASKGVTPYGGLDGPPKNLTGLRALAGKSMLFVVTGPGSGWGWGGKGAVRGCVAHR